MFDPSGPTTADAAARESVSLAIDANVVSRRCCEMVDAERPTCLKTDKLLQLFQMVPPQLALSNSYN